MADTVDDLLGREETVDTLLEPSTVDKVLGTIPKAAYALNKGIEAGVADLGTGLKVLSDPGPRRPAAFRSHIPNMARAGDFGFDLPRVDPLTLQPIGGQLDPLTRALSSLSNEREQARIEMRAPGQALEDAGRQLEQEFAVREEATPGSKGVAKGAETIGGMLPVVAEATIPFVGPGMAVATGGVQTTGSVYNQAYKYYRDQGYSDEQAIRLATNVAGRAGARNALLFAALPGPANKLSSRILGESLSSQPIAQALARTGLAGVQAGSVMAADTVLRDAEASETYRPDLTAGEAAGEAVQAFLTGAVTGAVLHGPGELARLPAKNQDATDLENDLGSGQPTAPKLLQLRNGPIITPPPARPPTITDVEMLMRDLPVLPIEERMTQAERIQALQNALQERAPVPAALLGRANQDRDVPFALPEGYARKGDQFVFTEPSKRLTPSQEMAREGQAAMAALREEQPTPDQDAAPDPVAEAAAVPVTAGEEPREPLVPVEVTAADVKAAKTRMTKRSPGEEKRVLAEDEARRELFEKAAFNQDRSGAEPVPANQLFVGDTFTVDGHRMHVREWVNDVETGKPAGVKLQGAFGDQYVPSEQTVHVDKGSLAFNNPDLLDRADSALKARQDEIHRAGRLRGFGDPELLMLATARGAVKIAKGVRDFAKWSAEMVKEFGEVVRPHLDRIWKDAQRVVNGDHPTIGLSERGIKTVGDEGLNGQVRDAVNPTYAKRSNETDTDLVRRLVSESGGARRAAQAWLDGQFRDAPGSVQTILASEIQRQLAKQEQSLRSQGKTAEADGIVQEQIRLAQSDIARATDTAQALQAFQAHYANWSPAAWLANFRKNITRIAAERVSRVTEQTVPPDPKKIGEAIAEHIASGLDEKQPKLAKTLREQFGGKGEPKPIEQRLRENGTPEAKVKETARKVEKFYKEEVGKWRKRYGIPEFDTETEKNIVRRANGIEKLPEDSVQRRQAAQDLFTHLQRLKGFEWWELPMDFWYANVLSGVSTHAKNILGNAVNLGAETAVQMLRHPTAIPQILEALGRSVPKATREAGSILRSGRDTAGRHGDKFEAPGVMERIENPALSKLLLPWKLVGRFLKAEDAGFFYPLQEVKGVVLARRAAAAEGLPILGGKRAARARTIMAWTAEARAKAEAQADQEGLTGSLRARRVDEITEQARPPQLMENARDFAFLGTFNNEPYGVLGALTDSWHQAAQRVPALKLVIPFTRIVANLSNSMLNWTPVGSYRAARGQGYKLLVGRADHTGKLFGKTVQDPEAIGDLYARSVLGTVALTGIAAAAGQYLFDRDPKFMVTAQGPTDPDQRSLLQAAGWIPYSLKIGNRYYSYQDKPIALPLSIIGHYVDAMRYRKLDQQDAINRSAYAVGAAGNVILNSSWLQGLSSVFNQANRDSVQSPLKALPAQAIKTTASFVVPNALKQIDQLFDDTKYTADDIRSMMLRETPFARRENQPDVNVFGEPVHAPLSKMFWSTATKDPLLLTLAGRRLWPSVPIEGELTPAEQYQLIRYRGPTLRVALQDRLAELASLPHAEAQALVEKISREKTTEAKQALGLVAVNRLRQQIRDMKER